MPDHLNLAQAILIIEHICSSSQRVRQRVTLRSMLAPPRDNALLSAHVRESARDRI